MQYRAIRRDLTEISRKCDFCPKYLTSLKAYVLQDLKTGRLAYAGPTCAKNNASEVVLSEIPDLTKFTMAIGDQRVHQRSHNNGQRSGSVANAEKNAIEYLVLRESKLFNELNCSYRVLKKYNSQGLSQADIRHINNIASKAPENLTLLVLQKIYSYLFWIDIAIKKLPAGKTDFLVNVRKTIVSKRKITDIQKVAIDRWLENIEGVPQLK